MISYREQQVINLVLKGLSNNEIGKKLGVTEKTVKFHLTNIFKKLGLKSRSQLLAKHIDERITSSELAEFRKLL